MQIPIVRAMAFAGLPAKNLCPASRVFTYHADAWSTVAKMPYTLYPREGQGVKLIPPQPKDMVVELCLFINIY